MKHTPGPWKVQRNSRIEIKQDNDDRLALLAHVYVSGKSFGVRYAIPEAEANANLIAAAPELLSFAQQFLVESEHANAEDDFDWQPGELMELARSVIAKAEGK